MTEIHISNIPFRATEQDLRALLLRFGLRPGPITFAMDKERQQHRGFAFVEMGTAEAATKAVAVLAGAALDGRDLRIELARTT